MTPRKKNEKPPCNSCTPEYLVVLYMHKCTRSLVNNHRFMFIHFILSYINIFRDENLLYRFFIFYPSILRKAYFLGSMCNAYHGV